jgi:hypothetical protein
VVLIIVVSCQTSRFERSRSLRKYLEVILQLAGTAAYRAAFTCCFSTGRHSGTSLGWLDLMLSVAVCDEHTGCDGSTANDSLQALANPGWVHWYPQRVTLKRHALRYHRNTCHEPGLFHSSGQSAMKRLDDHNNQKAELFGADRCYTCDELAL